MPAHVLEPLGAGVRPVEQRLELVARRVVGDVLAEGTRLLEAVHGGALHGGVPDRRYDAAVGWSNIHYISKTYSHQCFSRPTYENIV